MAYNRGYDLDAEGYHQDTGCVDFPEQQWQGWHSHWAGREPERFYAYLKQSDGSFVGEVNFHRAEDACSIGIVIDTRYRGKGYCKQGLELLIDRARRAGVKRLRNEFEYSRIAAMKGHLAAGFLPAGAHDGCCVLELQL